MGNPDILLGLNAFMGIFMVVGGSIGYLKKKSAISLLAGSLVGSWYLFAVKLYVEGNKGQGGEADMKLHAKLVSAVVGLGFLYRYVTGGKTMALVIAASAALTGVANLLL